MSDKLKIMQPLNPIQKLLPLLNPNRRRDEYLSEVYGDFEKDIEAEECQIQSK